MNGRNINDLLFPRSIDRSSISVWPTKECFNSNNNNSISAMRANDNGTIKLINHTIKNRSVCTFTFHSHSFTLYGHFQCRTFVNGELNDPVNVLNNFFFCNFTVNQSAEFTLPPSLLPTVIFIYKRSAATKFATHGK